LIAGAPATASIVAPAVAQPLADPGAGHLPRSRRRRAGLQRVGDGGGEFIAAGLNGDQIKDNSSRDGKRIYDTPCGSH